jgi:photosystem II stability/assembly factor-like uncharacterized protein
MFGSRLVATSALVVCALLGGAQLAHAAPVSVGHSGWSWGDPRPQGNSLQGLDFAGARGYAAGGFGTLLRTDDAGETWTGVSTGLTDALRQVRAIDANTVVIGGACALRRSDDGGQSFTRLPWTSSDESCPSPIVSFHFPSPSTGYLLTENGSVFKTADGGNTFSRVTSIPGTASAGGGRTPTDIFFTSDNAGVTTADEKVFRTTDGGNSWTEVASATRALRGLLFVSGGVGYAVGSGTTMLASNDTGASWVPQPLTGVPGELDLNGVDCADATTCLITEASGGRLVRTTDGGVTGSSITASTERISAAAFSSVTGAIAVGNRGATVESDDGGMTWSPIGDRIPGTGFTRLRSSSPQLAQAGGENGGLARTTDAGTTWFTVGVPTTERILDSSFPSQDVGFALDTSGGAFKTQNGGTSWQILSTGTTAAPSSILALDPNLVLLIGPRGVRRSTDGGGSFEAVGSKRVRRAGLFDVDSGGGEVVAAWGARTLLLSGNGGQTWKSKRLPGRRSRLDDVDFVSGRVGYALTTDSRVWRTTNGGKKWKDVPGIGTSGGFELSFSDPNAGYVSSDRLGPEEFFGFAFRTTDAGRSWQPQLIAETPVEVWDAGPTGFGLTLPGPDANGAPLASSFFATTSGGQAGTPSSLTIRKGKARSAQAEATQSKRKRIRVAGTLSPPEGGERIVVSIRQRGKWSSQVATAASNGQFTASFKVKKTSFVVAQWSGDDDRAGAGSRALKLKVKKKGKKGKGKKGKEKGKKGKS